MTFLFISSGLISISPLCQNTEVNNTWKNWKCSPLSQALPHGGCLFEVLMVQLSQPQKRSMATCSQSSLQNVGCGQAWTDVWRPSDFVTAYLPNIHRKVWLWKLLPSPNPYQKYIILQRNDKAAKLSTCRIEFINLFCFFFQVVTIYLLSVT